MKPAALERLQAVADLVSDGTRTARSAIDIISDMQTLHGATYGLKGGAYFIRCAGVSASCTWSRDQGVLQAWNRNATLRIAKERMA